MKAEYWKKALIKMVLDENEEQLNLFGEMLEECDEAKQLLRDKGYGWLGLSLLETVKEVPEA